MPSNPIIATDPIIEKEQNSSGFVAVKIPFRLIGTFILLTILFCFAAFSSWSVDDPSLSFAADKSPANWMGYPGAVVADIWMQFFGLASLILLLPPTIWGWAMLKKRTPEKWPLRILTMFGAGILSAGTLSCFTVPSSWPLPTGLGGLVGSAFTSLAQFVTGSPPSGAGAILYAIILLPPTLALLWHAMGITAMGEQTATELATSETENYDDTKDQTGFFDVMFGGAAHLFFTAKTAWRRTRTNSAERRAKQADEEWQHQANAQTEPNISGLVQQTDFENPVHYSEFERQNFSARQDPPMMQSDAIDLPQDTFEPSFEEQNIAPVEPVTAYEDHLAQLNVEQSLPTNRPMPVVPTPQQLAASSAAIPRVSQPVAAIKQGTRAMREAQGSLLQETGFQLPELSLLSEPPATTLGDELHPDELEIKARQLEGVLDDFGIKGDIIDVRPGPVVTLYELTPAPGIKSSRVISLADDIARSMSAVSARVAVVPGRNAIGIELPNEKRETVFLHEMLASSDFEKTKAKLPFCLGKDISGQPVIADLARMPHLLIAGTTGSGKSVAVNTMILSLLYRMTPEQCRLIMIDPKMLELSIYDGIPHLLTPVVTDPSKAVVALKWAVREMEDRYRKMSKIGVRNIEGFNAKVKQANLKGETITRTVQTGFNKETGEPLYESETFELEPLPFIVVIVDEMADLMMVAGKDIEGAIQRLAQMARAAGIHLVMATQRPSVDVITGTIKANFPTRISFSVTSKIDSRTILGEMGAEQLLGMGDMLYMAGGGRSRRLHGPFVADNEVEDVVNHLKAQGIPDYLENVTEEVEEAEAVSELGNSGDELYDKAVNIVLNDRKASTSYIQRRLSIGYNRAATLIEKMENEGVISPANHAGKREVLVGEGIDH